MNVNVIDETIKNIVKDEDAAQDVWVMVLERNIEDITQITEIARSYRLNDRSRFYEVIGDNPISVDDSRTRFDLIPSQPLEHFNDGGWVEHITNQIGKRRVYHPLGLRMPSAKRGREYNNGKYGECPHCGSIRVKLYGAYKGINRFWCKNCHRKFRKGAIFHKRMPKVHYDMAVELRRDNLSYRRIIRELYLRFGHQYSTNTMSLLFGGVTNQMGTLPKKGYRSIVVDLP